MGIAVVDHGKGGLAVRAGSDAFYLEGFDWRCGAAQAFSRHLCPLAVEDRPVPRSSGPVSVSVHDGCSRYR